MKRHALIALVALVAGSGCSSTNAWMRGHVGPTYPDRILAPAAYEASLEAAIAEAKGDWPAAVTWLTTARDLDRDALDLQARLGLALCHVGKHDAAMFAFADVLRIEPTLERALTERAKCALFERRPDDARRDLETAVISSPNEIEPTLLLVEIERAAGAVERARWRIEECARLHPYAPEVLRVVADVRRLRGDEAGAFAAERRRAAIDGTAAPVDPPATPPRSIDPRCAALTRSVRAASEGERAVIESVIRIACDGTTP